MSPIPSDPQRDLANPILWVGGLGLAALLALSAMSRFNDGLIDYLLPLFFAGAVVAIYVRTVARVKDSQATSPTARSSTPRTQAPYESLIDALPDPVLLISALEPDDLTGRRIVLTNQAARDLLRMPTSTGLLVTAIRDPEVLEAVDEALFGEVPSSALYEPGGAQARVFQALSKPLGKTPDGARLALLVLRDETDVRRAERTRADFLANASHELRTPLASLTGFIETLRGHAKSDEVARARFLSIMQVQAERMARLIDDLLSLSRIELNEHIAPHGEVDMSLAAADVLDALGPLAQERKVVFYSQLGARGAMLVDGDRDQIVQVIQNLVDNALKYAPPESVVEVSLEGGLRADQAIASRRTEAARMSLLTPDHAGDRYVALRISDQGLGLRRENLPRLAERFYRVEGQKSGERAGTGLGLAIVKHIVNRHRGGLAVESVEGDGSTFTAYFPQPAPPVL